MKPLKSSGAELLPAERFLDLLIDRVGYSSYLKDQIRKELKSSGDPVTQITVLQGAIRELNRRLKNLLLRSQSFEPLNVRCSVRIGVLTPCGLVGSTFEPPRGLRPCRRRF